MKGKGIDETHATRDLVKGVVKPRADLNVWAVETAKKRQGEYQRV